MSAPRLAVLPGDRSDRAVGWETVLEQAVRPEFRVRVYRPEPADRVLFGPTCIVAGCAARGLQRAEGATGHLCGTHARAWRADGEPPQSDWAASTTRGMRSQRILERCQATGCVRSVNTRGCVARTTTTGSEQAARPLSSSSPTLRRSGPAAGSVSLLDVSSRPRRAVSSVTDIRRATSGCGATAPT